ncbi:DUF2147 domain-containing protein [Mangrovicella endophytica]|uniref:DUF2147 domain-containing protein n=1 Tax=Mangrovicella endophytica TaxID=2066697 RepID=UPI000C9DFE15|nr:DUF2147 domain-containing protein [Mangrovicella endophytica]
MPRTTMTTLAIAGTLLLGTIGSAAAADPILGKWRAPGGGIVQVETCGGGYCATVISGKHKGKAAGEMQGANGEYSGTVIDPRDDKTYSGSASIDGDRMSLKGCALKIFCKTQTWVRV